MKYIYFYLTILLSFNAFLSQAQHDGVADIRLVTHQFNCEDQVLFVDLEIKANNPNSEFKLGSHNIRMSHERKTIAPYSSQVNNTNPQGQGESFQISEELDIVGLVMSEDGFSFFYPHTLMGSMDTISSYNVALVSGVGVNIYHNKWTKIGRIKLEINLLDNEPIRINFLDEFQFPRTTITAVDGPGFYDVELGDLENYVFEIPYECRIGVDLPVELTKFTATDKGCEANIQWETATEENAAYFVVEESRDGIHFEELMLVEAFGNSESTRQYEILDEKVWIDNYYRLVQVDMDGTAHYFDPVYLKSSCYDESITSAIEEVFPNPVINQKHVFIKYYSAFPDPSSTVQITDIMGRVVLLQSVALEEGENTVAIPVDRLSTGLYSISLHGEGWFARPKKLVKTK